MNIILVTDAWFPQINGVVTTWNHVRVELEQLGHAFAVIQPGQFATVPCPRYPEIRLSLTTGRKVARMLEAMDFDALHIATEGPLGFSARRWATRQGVAFTTSYHTQFPMYLQRYTGLPGRWGYAGLRWFHRPAQRTLVPTPQVKDQLQQHGFENIMVWTQGVDTERFRPGEKNLYPDPRPVFLYAGRVAQEKNLEAFLNADLPGSKWIVGDGPALVSLKHRYPDVRFTGFKHGEELARHFAAADVFVFPSRTDTFGVVMLEAMASGLPVAAYPVTGPIDVVKHGETGILDEDLGRAAIEAAKLSPGVCREFALGFTWRRCAEILLKTPTPARSTTFDPTA